ncbi:MAG: excinuclease ABC subunit UvrC [Holophagaceae bacterium]|nr:excinuclease ABC subunit UvrC [Holophagaceae bacterium]
MGKNRHNVERSQLLARALSDLPDNPGVYLYSDKSENLLYVGKAKNLKKRIKSYFQSRNLDAKTKRLVARIWSLEFIVCSNELEALMLENNLIKEHLPPFNIILRDDKSYPYVKITWKSEFPQVYVTRHMVKDGSIYFGPFFPASTAYRRVELVKRFFMLRDCDLLIDGKRTRACLQYQLNRCTGPCIGAVAAEAYRDQAKEAKLFLEGKREELKSRLEEVMWHASQVQAFEQASQYRDTLQQIDAWFDRQKAILQNDEDQDVYGSAALNGRICIHRLMLREGHIIGRKEYVLDDTEALTPTVIAEALQRVYAEESVPGGILVETEPEDKEVLREWLGTLRGTLPKINVPKRGEKVELLQMAQENARMALERKFEPEELNKAVLKGLQAFLNLPNLPSRIECFDVSHGQGREVVASCIVFSAGLPDKASYRRFKLSNQQNDDFSNMAEVITRRYKRMVEEGRELPSLVVVDGGVGQLHAAEAALKGLGVELQLAALAKKEESIFRPGSNEPLKIPKSSPVLQLLQRIRDEAHRFAIAYHRSLRAKRTIQTELTSIRGIGQATAKKLLIQFGSVAKVRAADEEELVKAVGSSAARKVIDWRRESIGEGPDI